MVLIKVDIGCTPGKQVADLGEYQPRFQINELAELIVKLSVGAGLPAIVVKDGAGIQILPGRFRDWSFLNWWGCDERLHPLLNVTNTKGSLTNAPAGCGRSA